MGRKAGWPEALSTVQTIGSMEFEVMFESGWRGDATVSVNGGVHSSARGRCLYTENKTRIMCSLDGDEHDLRARSIRTATVMSI
jgi:hypothetical protein